jgi:hypothetical protein
VVDGFPAQQMLSRMMRVKLDGVTGCNFLKEFKVTIDYTSGTLQLN